MTASNVVFVLGIERRSGTNFLSDLLCLHPDVHRRPGLPEDFLLQQAHHLNRYVEGLRRAWPRRWGVEPQAEQAVLRQLGDGLLRWLVEPVGSRAGTVVTKTPSVENLELAPLLWPEATFLVLVRDGRGLVESGVRSFDWSYRAAAQRWAAAARTVLSFDARYRDTGLRYRLIRYEDLAAMDADVVRDLYEFCGLAVDPLSEGKWRESLDRLPVRGSSESRTAGRVSWQPAERRPDFDPSRRFSGWSPARQAQFARIAGAEQRALGYAVDDTARTDLQAELSMAWQGRSRWLRRLRRQARLKLIGPA